MATMRIKNARVVQIKTAGGQSCNVRELYFFSGHRHLTNTRTNVVAVARDDGSEDVILKAHLFEEHARMLNHTLEYVHSKCLRLLDYAIIPKTKAVGTFFAKPLKLARSQVMSTW